jgi:hypothetical protein
MGVMMAVLHKLAVSYSYSRAMQFGIMRADKKPLGCCCLCYCYVLWAIATAAAVCSDGHGCQSGSTAWLFSNTAPSLELQLVKCAWSSLNSSNSNSKM